MGGITLEFGVALFALFCLSVDYAVVMPSLWLFLQSLDPNVGEIWLGLCIGGFQLANLICQPFVGLWLDRRPMKEVMITQLWIAITASVLYTLAGNVGWVLASRVVGGVGFTVFLSCTVFVVKTSTEEDRSSQMALLQTIGTVGLIFGPAINYPLSLMRPVRLFSWLQLNSYNVVGLIVAALNLIALLLIHAFFKEPVSVSKGPRGDFSKLDDIRQFVTLGTAGLLLSYFVGLFNQTSIEVAFTPMLIDLYGFGQFFNSVAFGVLAVYMIIGFLSVGAVSKRFQDRTLILFGWIFVSVGLALFLVFFHLSPSPPLWQFVIAVCVLLISVCLFETAVPSLYSKLATRGQSGAEGRAMALMQNVQSLAMMVAPIATSPVLAQSFFLLFVVLGALSIAAFGFFAISFRRLVFVPETVQVQEISETAASIQNLDETLPLIQ